MINNQTTPSGALNCPSCGRGDSRVIDTRPSAGSLRRRRECTDCLHRYTTREIVHAEGGDFMLVARDEWAVVMAALASIEALNIKYAENGHTAIKMTKHRRLMAGPVPASLTGVSR